jgi:hypothetical protein
MICHVMGPTDNLSFACQAVASQTNHYWYLSLKSSVADLDSMNPDLAFQVDPDPNPTFQVNLDPDPGFR